MRYCTTPPDISNVVLQIVKNVKLTEEVRFLSERCDGRRNGHILYWNQVPKLFRMIYDPRNFAVNKHLHCTNQSIFPLRLGDGNKSVVRC